MILNDFDTEAKTGYFKGFVERISDIRLIQIINETISIRKDFLSNKGLLIGVMNHISNKLSQNHNFCIVGDFNISFCDNYYFTNWGRNELNRSFAETEIINLTQSKTETIDHIAISKKFCKDSKVEVTKWNCGKELSDHKGISVKLH